MRSPVPFTAPSLPVVASALIRDDVPLSDIAPAAWNALGHSQPFLSHAYLSALHETGCASPETGWSPHYLTAWRDGALVGALPLLCEGAQLRRIRLRLGLGGCLSPPRPPLLPQVGRRGSLHAGTRTTRAGAATPRRDAQLLVHAIASVRDGGHSSLHVLFPTPAEAAEGEALGMIPRAGLQFHWTNPGYRDFADFLATFAHDKRKKVKQERRRVAEAGVTFERRRGHDITPEDWDFFYRRYQQTYREHHSTPYLTREFFERIGAALPDHMLLVIGSAQRAQDLRRAGSPRRRDALGPLLGHRANSSPACTSKPATTSPSSSASSSASRASKAARRACTSSRADCCRSPRIRCTSSAIPASHPPSPTTARANASTSRTPPANWKRHRRSGKVTDSLIHYTGVLSTPAQIP